MILKTSCQHLKFYQNSSKTEKKRASLKHRSQCASRSEFTLIKNEAGNPKILNESRYGASPDIVHYKSLLNEEPIVNESQNNQNEIEDQINMFSSQAMQNQNTAKIVQFYESIIFKMSEEMQKLLINKWEGQKCEQLEKAIEELKSNVENERLAVSQKMSFMIAKTQELEGQVIAKDKTLNECKKIIEQLENKLSDHTSEISNQVTVNTRLAKSEIELKAKLENAKAKNMNQEEILRKASEENYSLKSEIK